MLVVKQIPREPYQRVLIPQDFSKRSMAMLRMARAVAPQAQLSLMHAFAVPFERLLRHAGVEEATVHGYRVVAKREATEQMNELIRASGLPDGVVRRIVLHGDPSLCILQQEQEQNCDLIVIGKHGQTAVEELLLGSVTKHILAHSTCDVLVADREP